MIIKISANDSPTALYWWWPTVPFLSGENWRQRNDATCPMAQQSHFSFCNHTMKSLVDHRGKGVKCDENSMLTYFRMTQPVPAGGATQNTWIRVLLRGVLSVTATGQLLINCVSSSSMIYGKPAENKHIKMCFDLGRLLCFWVDTSLILFLNLSFCVSSSGAPDTRVVPGVESQSLLVELMRGQGFGICSRLSGTRILGQHFEDQSTRGWSCSFH